MGMVSFIVPAHDEAGWVRGCVESIHAAMRDGGGGLAYEVVVVDDASTDGTGAIAEAAGARVERVALRQVGAVRNAGVRVARGGWLFFVDADTRANPAAVAAGLEVLGSGVPAGGCVFEFDGAVPWWGRAFHRFGVVMGRLLGLTGGCFLFCTREAFDAAGGFSERLRAGEDLAFVQALKRTGTFELAGPPVVTSARKLRVVGFWEVARLVVTILVRGSRYESPWAVDIMYGRRAAACREGGGAEGSSVRTT